MPGPVKMIRFGAIAAAGDFTMAAIVNQQGTQTRAAIAALIQDIAAGIIADDPAIIAAAEQAVADALAAAGFDFSAPVAGVSVAVVDADDNLTFMTANDVDGAPTDEAAELIGKSIGMRVENHPGMAFAVTDQLDNLTFLAVNDTDGGPAPEAAQLIATHVGPLLNSGGGGGGVPTSGDLFLAEVRSGDLWVNNLSQGSQTRLVDAVDISGDPQVIGSRVVWRNSAGVWQNVPAEGGTPGPLYPVSALVARGDSHVNNAAGNQAFTNTLASVLGVTVTNDGHGGWGSTDIAVNAGAIRPRLTLSGGEVPASGPVTITGLVPTRGWRTFGGNSVITIPGILRAPSGGIPGVLTFTASTGLHEFTRTTAGDVVPVPADVVFDGGNGHVDETQLVWFGHNDIPYGDGPSGLAQFLANAQAMVDRQSSLVERTVFLELLTTSTDYRGSTRYNRLTAASQALRDAGFLVCPVRRYLIDDCLTDLGLTPTGQDLIAIDRDTIPPQLMHSDQTHLLAPAATAVAEYVAAWMTDRGWY